MNKVKCRIPKAWDEYDSLEDNFNTASSDTEQPYRWIDNGKLCTGSFSIPKGDRIVNWNEVVAGRYHNVYYLRNSYANATDNEDAILLPLAQQMGLPIYPHSSHSSQHVDLGVMFSSGASTIKTRHSIILRTWSRAQLVQYQIAYQDDQIDSIISIGATKGTLSPIATISVERGDDHLYGRHFDPQGGNIIQIVSKCYDAAPEVWMAKGQPNCFFVALAFYWPAKTDDNDTDSGVKLGLAVIDDMYMEGYADSREVSIYALS